MNYASLSRDELIKSALNAIQDLDFIFKRSTDNPFEKQTNHLLPVVSRPLDHIREVAMALDNLFMQQFNNNERSGPGTFHPNSGVSFHNFGAPPHNMFNPNYNPNMPNMHMLPPHMGNHNTFAPYMRMVPPPQPGFNVGGPYSQMFYSTTHSDSNPFRNSLELKAILAMLELLKDDPKVADVVAVLVEQLFPNQERCLNLSLQLLFNSIQKKDRVNFSEEELKEILQAIKTNIECWLLVVNSKAFQPRPKLELEDWKAIEEACGANMSVVSEHKGALKKLILISAKSRALEYEKRTLNELVLQSFLTGAGRPLMELKGIAKQVIANWPKENAKDLQDFFENVLFCLQDESRAFENPSFQTLTRVEKTLAKQEHYPWDTFLLKLTKASLKKDTLEIFGAVLILLEYAEKPEAKSSLSKDNANFKKDVVTHLKAVESSINDFLWRKADGDKLIYKHLIDLFTYLSKTQ